MLNPQLQHHLNHFNDPPEQESNNYIDSIEDYSIEKQNEARGEKMMTWNTGMFPDLVVHGAIVIVAAELYHVRSSHLIQTVYRLLWTVVGAVTSWGLVYLVKIGLKAYQQRCVQRYRTRVCELLATLGAPLLTVHQEEVPSSLKGMATVEALLLEQVELIQTADQIMTVLRQTTSVQLGLGRGNTGGVAVNLSRVERSYVGKALRSKRPISLSLNIVRKRLFQGLRLQIKTLYEALDLEYSFNESSSDVPITLSLLQSLRQELLELLAEVAFSSRAHELFAHSATRAARESRVVLQDCLVGLPKVGDDCATLSPLSVQVDGLASLMIACCNINGPLVASSEFITYWEEVKRTCNGINTHVQQADNILFPPDEPPQKEEVEQAISPSERTSSIPFLQEYSTDDSSTVESNTGVTPTLQKQSKSVLVYSGHGNAQLNRKRKQVRSVKGNSISSSTCPMTDPATEQQLMEELRKHLQAMPVEEEINVNENGTTFDEGSFTDVSRELDEMDEGFKTSPFASFFLEELTKALPPST